MSSYIGWLIFSLRQEVLPDLPYLSWKIVVICFGTGVSFGSLAEALKNEVCGSDPIGYQMVDFNQKFAVVFKSAQK